MDKKTEKEIRIKDLEEVFITISELNNPEIWYRELTSIENAIDFIKKC